MNAYSFSRLKAWNECPLSFKLSYIDKVGKDENDVLTLGSAAHEFFEAWVSGGCPADWLEIATKTYVKEPRNQSLFNEYLEICTAFVKDFDPKKEIPEGSQSFYELKMALDVDLKPVSWTSDAVRFRGVIDRLDVVGKKAKITDYKTGFFGKSDAFQNSLYAWMLTKIHPEIENFETIIYYTRTGWKEISSFHKDSLGGIEFQVKAMMEAVDNDKKFKAKPGSRCSTCFVAFACNKKASSVNIIEDQKSAFKVAEDILAGEAQLDAKKSLLKSWVGENGELTVNGEKFGFFPVETVKADTREIFNVLANSGKDSFEYLKADTREIKKLCREDSSIADALAQHLEFKTSLRFSHKGGK
jgi:CRISPR/Cas system-associated exonuclease Cas4 (RecB family)